MSNPDFAPERATFSPCRGLILEQTMIGMILVEVFIKAFLLCMLLYIVAQDEADYEFRKAVMVTAGIIFGITLIDATLTRFIGLFTLLPMLALIVFMVMQFCWVRFWKAMLIAVPFLMLNTMIATATASFRQKSDMAIARGLQGPVSEQDMKEAMTFLQQSVGDGSMPLPVAPAEPVVVETSLPQVLLKTLKAGIAPKKVSFKNVPGDKAIPVQPSLPQTSPPPVVVSKESNRVNDAETVPVPADAENSIAESSNWREASKKITIGGTLVEKDGVRVAVVNNKIVKEGELVQVEYKRMIYRWRADSINAQGVSWRPLEAVPK